MHFDHISVLILRTNGFHIAMCLLRNRAQMMSKCDENKKVAYKGHLKVSVMLLLQLKQTHSNMKSTFFKIIKQKKKLMVRSSIGIPKQCLYSRLSYQKT